MFIVIGVQLLRMLLSQLAHPLLSANNALYTPIAGAKMLARYFD